jgi:hypothetical protein
VSRPRSETTDALHRTDEPSATSLIMRTAARCGIVRPSSTLVVSSGGRTIVQQRADVAQSPAEFAPAMAEGGALRLRTVGGTVRSVGV